jgi:AI-2 transport protein TqsA
MNTPEVSSPQEQSPARPWPKAGRDAAALHTAAVCLFIAAAAWYLLGQLAGLFRPLLLAVFLCYIILPAHFRLRERIPSLASIAVLTAASVGALCLLALVLYGSALELSEDLPRLTDRALFLFRQARSWVTEHLPWTVRLHPETAQVEGQSTALLQDAVRALLTAAAGVLSEALVVGFYLLFLLLEAGRFPRRVRAGFATARADEILAVAQRINQAMASYLKVKVQASLVLAVPAGLVLWAFGVKFPLLWAVLTFLLNFVPYLGSVVTCSLPIVLAFLELNVPWTPWAVAGLLIGLHVLSAYVVEPAMTGRAVGLSPLIILLALAFWGQCWGLIGMLLAVPLTVLLRMVLENVPVTRPFAKLMADE